MAGLPGNLNIRQHRFVERYLQGQGKARDAYLEVYPDSSPHSADSSASDLLNSPKIRAAILNKLNQEKPLEEQIKIAVTDAITALKDDPADHNIRLKAVDTVLKIAGAYAPAESHVTSVAAKISVKLNPVISRFVILHGRYPNADERVKLGLGAGNEGSEAGPEGATAEQPGKPAPASGGGE